MSFLIKGLCVFLISWLNMVHPVHVSITNLEYIPSENKVKLSFKVFEDDIQLLFAHLYQINADFSNEDSYYNYQSKIDEYFTSHFKILIGEKEHKFSYKSFKKEGHTIWFYYETNIDSEPKSIEFFNTIFLDLYFDQKNLLIFSYKCQDKAYQFDLKNTNYLIEFDDF